VVTREELRSRIWPAGTFVDFEQALNKAVNKVREILCDSAGAPRYIETLARRGYRFVAPVELNGAQRAALAFDKFRLAVLPLQNLSGDPAQEYFADGMTEEMISQLGRLNPQQLGIIARTSVMQYKNSTKGIDQIGRELQADYIVEGSIRRDGQGVRITVQLIQVEDQAQIWTATYSRDLPDVLEVQSEVAAHIARELACELLPDFRVTAQRWRTVDPDAIECYLRGRFFWNQRSEEGVLSAIRCFEEALEHDPSCAPAYASIAGCYAMLPWFGALTPHQAAPKAKAAAQKALQIDDSLAEAHGSLGMVRFWYDWDWGAAEAAFRRALELNANCAVVHQWYAAFLNAMGQFAQATVQQQTAQDLDPLSLIIAANACDSCFYTGRYDEAIIYLRCVLEREPRFSPAHFNLGRVYIQKKMYAEAIACFEKAVQLSGNREGLPALGYACARGGHEARARAILEEVSQSVPHRYMSSTMIALIHLGLGAYDTALNLLERAVQERCYWLVFLKVDPMFAPLRGLSRFEQLLARVGFSDELAA
jgi:TolB-like protein/tetratricopeptide (TPR) repeat protein